jgi:hypothetical protein
MTRPVCATAIGLCLTLAFVWPPASAQAPRRDSAPPAAGSAIVRGRVVAADTGQPIRDGTVVLENAARRGPVILLLDRPRPMRVSTGENGEFEIARIPAGRYRIEASPATTDARYLSHLHPDPIEDDGEALTLTEGQVISGLIVRLPRAAAIEGRVVRSSGDPAAFVRIELLEPDTAASVNTSYGLHGDMVSTDDLGRFRLFGLRPGEYLLAASAVPLGGIRARSFPVRTYYPGTSNVDHASPLRLRGGQELTSIEFAIAPARAFTVRGALVDATGRPAAGVRINLVRKERSIRESAITATDGSFEFEHLPAGDATITVYRVGDHTAGRPAEYAAVPLTIAGDVEGLGVALRPGVTLHGSIGFEGGAPESDEIFHVRTVAGVDTGGTVEVSSQADAERSFVLNDLFGPLLIRVSSSRQWVLKTVLCNGRDITDRPAEFRAGDSVRVVLGKTAGSLKGRVTNRRGTGVDATVVVFSEDRALWHSRFTTTRSVRANEDGAYVLDGLRAGRYLVGALPPGQLIPAQMTPRFLERVAAIASPIEIGDGVEQTLDLQLGPIQP